MLNPELINKLKEVIEMMSDEDVTSIGVTKVKAEGGEPSKPEITPRVKKMLEMFDMLPDEEKKMFHETAYPDMKMKGGKCPGSDEGEGY